MDDPDFPINIQNKFDVRVDYKRICLCSSITTELYIKSMHGMPILLGNIQPQSYSHVEVLRALPRTAQHCFGFDRSLLKPYGGLLNTPARTRVLRSQISSQQLDQSEEKQAVVGVGRGRVLRALSGSARLPSVYMT